MPPSNLALPFGSLVLVTGANGYICSHVVNSLLELGSALEEWSASPSPGRRTDLPAGMVRTNVVVPQIDISDAFKESIKGVDGVVHVVSERNPSNMAF